MTPAMTHERALEELEAVALGAAAPDVQSGVVAHAAECEECAESLRELRQIGVALTAFAPERTPNRGRSAGIRSRLLARASSDADVAARKRGAAAAAARAQAVEHMTRAPATVPARPLTPASIPAPIHVPAPTPARSDTGVGVRRWAVAATIALLATSALFVREWLARNSAAQQFASRETELTERVDSLQRALAEKDRAMAVVSAPGVRIVNLTNWSGLGRPLARMFWDSRSDRWTLLVYELRQPRPGRAFQIWLVNQQQRRVSAGMFRPGADGTAMMEGRQEMGPGALTAVAITEEPATGVDAPSGPVVLAGGVSP